jgi:hypothetical protein
MKAMVTKYAGAADTVVKADEAGRAASRSRMALSVDTRTAN